MENLLNRWMQKSSWKAMFPFTCIYRDAESGYTDLDLRNMLLKRGYFKYSPTILSGCEGIEVFPAMVDAVKFVQKTRVKTEIPEIAQDLLTIIKSFYAEHWDQSIFHVVLASGGYDSRMAMWAIRQLEKEGKDLGEYLFICHEDGYPNESECFMKAMKEFGYRDDRFMVWNQGKVEQEDYYHFPHLNENTNGFFGPEYDFIPHTIDRSKSCLVTSNFIRAMNDIRFVFDSFFPLTNKMNTLAIYPQWADFLNGNSNYNYINYIRWIDPAFYTAPENAPADDIIRGYMHKLTGSLTKCYSKHKYVFKFSHETIDRIQNEYLHSKLVQNCTAKEIQNAKPWEHLHEKTSFDMKCLGLASVLEGVDIIFRN